MTYVTWWYLAQGGSFKFELSQCVTLRTTSNHNVNPVLGWQNRTTGSFTWMQANHRVWEPYNLTTIRLANLGSFTRSYCYQMHLGELRIFTTRVLDPLQNIWTSPPSKKDRFIITMVITSSTLSKRFLKKFVEMIVSEPKISNPVGLFPVWRNRYFFSYRVLQPAFLDLAWAPSICTLN